MSTLTRASQLRRSLIVSRLRREIMRGSSAASISSISSSSSTTPSSSTTINSDQDSLNKLFALKSHFTELDERRRSAASLRLFGQIDGAVSSATSDKANFGAAANAQYRRRHSIDRNIGTVRNIEISDDNVADVDVLNNNENGLHEYGHRPFQTAEKGPVFRQNVSDFVGILENAIKEVETDEKRVYKPKAWTTDDIIQHPDSEVVSSARSRPLNINVRFCANV